MTNQRQIILEELKRLKTHPTADDLYRIVKKRLPKISLGTIYRNLEILSASGAIQKIEIAGTQKRFDGNADNHYHVRCISCGAVKDVEMETMLELADIVNHPCDYQIVDYRLELIGFCPGCRKA